MTLGEKFLLIVVVVLVAVLSVQNYRVNVSKRENAQLERKLQTQTQARQTLEWALANQSQLVRVFSAIREANRLARLDDEKQRDDAKQKITTAVADQACADSLVPAAAVDELRQLETRARTDSDSGSPD